MKGEGFDYRTTFDAVGDPRWGSTAKDDHIEKPRRTRAEIDTAVADAGCRLDTNYYGVRQATLTEYQNDTIARHRDRLNTVKLLNQARLANSAKVLGGDIEVSW